MTPKWDLIGLGGDLGDFWIVVKSSFRFAPFFIFRLLLIGHITPPRPLPKHTTQRLERGY